MWNWQSQLFAGGSGTGTRVSRTQSGKVCWPWITFCSSLSIFSGRLATPFMVGDYVAICQRACRLGLPAARYHRPKGLDDGSASPLHEDICKTFEAIGNAGANKLIAARDLRVWERNGWNAAFAPRLQSLPRSSPVRSLWRPSPLPMRT